MKNTEKEELAVAQLQAIVAHFNAGFEAWRREHGMVANFGWSYARNEQGEEAPKILQLYSVDRIIFRKPPPSPEFIRAHLGNSNDDDVRGLGDA